MGRCAAQCGLRARSDSKANNMTVEVLVNGGLELAINFEDARLWRGRSKPSWQAIVSSTLPNITRPWKPVFEPEPVRPHWH